MEILDAANPAEAAVWRERLEASGHMRDLHFEPQYLQAYAEEEPPTRALLLAGKQAVMLRGTEIGNVYCYGGPRCIALHELSPTITRYRYRLHPFLDADPNGEAGWSREKLIVYIDLHDEPTAELRKGHRSSVMLARRAGVTVEESDDIELFYAMYLEMCERNQADPKWRYSLSLLLKLKAAYPEGFKIVIASVDGIPEAGCILLGAYETCYYHYAASFNQHRDIGVGNLLVVEAAHMAKQLGYKRLHLGGGLTADVNDTLLRFKSGFSKRRCWVYRYEWQAKAEAA